MNMSEEKFQKKLTKQESIPKIEYYCAYQERCHKEVTDKLYGYGLNTDEVGEILSRLVKSNFLNEERFAIAFAGGKFRQKNWGKTKIVRELKSRGISEYCIKKALKEIEDDDYKNSLKLVAEKYIKTHPLKNDFTSKQKLLKHLMSKGYEYEQCQQIIQTIF